MPISLITSTLIHENYSDLLAFSARVEVEIIQTGLMKNNAGPSGRTVKGVGLLSLAR
jgi:hypothetical protein